MTPDFRGPSFGLISTRREVNGGEKVNSDRTRWTTSQRLLVVKQHKHQNIEIEPTQTCKITSIQRKIFKLHKHKF